MASPTTTAYNVDRSADPEYGLACQRASRPVSQYRWVHASLTARILPTYAGLRGIRGRKRLNGKSYWRIELNNSYYATKVGVYVDLANISLNGGYGLRFDVLRRFACRDNGQAIRLNVYLAFDEDRAKADPEYCASALNYHSLLRDWGYKVIEKEYVGILTIGATG